MRTRTTATIITAIVIAAAGITVASAAIHNAATTPQILTIPSTPPIPAYVGDSFAVEVDSTGSALYDPNRISVRVNPAVCSISSVTLQTKIINFNVTPSTVVVGNTATLAADAIDTATANVTLTHAGTCTISANQPSGYGYSIAVTARQVISVVKNP